MCMIDELSYGRHCKSNVSFCSGSIVRRRDAHTVNKQIKFNIRIPSYEKQKQVFFTKRGHWLPEVIDRLTNCVHHQSYYFRSEYSAEEGQRQLGRSAIGWLGRSGLQQWPMPKFTLNCALMTA